MSWFTKLQPHSHTYHTVAFDPSYATIYSDKTDKNYHRVAFEKCECGHRRITFGTDSYGCHSHKGITHAKHAWIEQHKLVITSDANIYDDNYQMTSAPGQIQQWEFKPITGVQQIVNSLRDDQEFQKLQSHNLVAAAFEQLETMIKLHENIDTE